MIFGILQMRNLAAEDYLSRTACASIPNIDHNTLEKVRQILEKGMRQGDNPSSVGLDLVGRVDPVSKQRCGGIIDLPKEKILEVEKAREHIESLDDAYLSLELRDKRFDRAFKKALNLRTPLSSDAVTRMMSAYENRIFLDYGQGIAQTEMMRSINHVEFMASLQILKEGNVHYEALTKEWDDCGDDKVRATHATMGIKYGKGKGIPIDEPFISPSGARLLYPGDTSLGAPYDEVVKCRCRAYYRVDLLYGVD